jgi:hypothetical protein
MQPLRARPAASARKKRARFIMFLLSQEGSRDARKNPAGIRREGADAGENIVSVRSQSPRSCSAPIARKKNHLLGRAVKTIFPTISYAAPL